MIVVTRTYILDCIHNPCCVLLPCALALIFDVISSHVTPTGIAARAIGPPGLRLGPSFAPIAILEQNSFASSSYTVHRGWFQEAGGLKSPAPPMKIPAAPASPAGDEENEDSS